MGPIYLFMERSFEPPARFEQVKPERGGRLSRKSGPITWTVAFPLLS